MDAGLAARPSVLRAARCFNSLCMEKNLSAGHLRLPDTLSRPSHDCHQSRDYQRSDLRTRGQLPGYILAVIAGAIFALDTNTRVPRTS